MSLSSQYTSIYLLIFCATHFSLLLNIIFYPFFTSTFKSEQSECKFVRRGTSLSPRTQYIMLHVIEGILIFLSN
jgi:hypothetical protein